MWFKNIQVYKLNNVKKYSEQELEDLLVKEIFVPCGVHDILKTGWDSIFEDDQEKKLTQKVGNCFFFKLRTEEKIIPSSVVKDQLKVKISKYCEENEGKKPSKNEKDDMKTNIIMGLAQNAFTASKFLDAYIDFDNELLFVNCGSPKKAEEFISHLRVTLGTLEAIPLEPENDVSEKLSAWLRHSSQPNEFEIGINCDFKDTDGGSISVKKHEIDIDEITQHLDNGKQVVKLELIWQKRIKFALTNKFEVKSIKMEDIVKEDIKDDLGDASDDYNVFQANMTLMTGDFAEIVSDLLRSF